MSLGRMPIRSSTGCTSPFSPTMLPESTTQETLLVPMAFRMADWFSPTDAPFRSDRCRIVQLSSDEGRLVTVTYCFSYVTV